MARQTFNIRVDPSCFASEGADAAGAAPPLWEMRFDFKPQSVRDASGMYAPSAAGDGTASLQFNRMGHAQSSAAGPLFACKTSEPAEPRFYLVRDTTAASSGARADGGAPAGPPRDGTYVLRRVQTVCRAALVQGGASAVDRGSARSSGGPVTAHVKRKRAGGAASQSHAHPPVRRVKPKAQSKEPASSHQHHDSSSSDEDSDDEDSDDEDSDDADELAALERDLL